ncbi:MAG: alpha/beta hydrolase [Verrucomicrobiales bacterium]|nr:alpha/beta hydrolase [Verrucomicrobiales bacterium]
MDHLITLTSGLKLGCAEYGLPTGTPAFYFHGWPSARMQAELMHEIAVEKGLRLIAPDRPGIGLSDVHVNRTLLDWPDTMEQLAAHFGFEKYHLFGWSGGGPYVLVTAHRLPHRVLSASIIAGAPPISFFGDRELFWVYRLLIRLRRHFPTVVSMLLRLGAFAIRHGKPDRYPLRWLVGMMGEEDKRILSDPHFYDVIRRGILASLQRGPRCTLSDGDIYLAEWGFDPSNVQSRIHFWHGKEDRNISWTYADRLASLMPHATTHWTERDGHYSLPITHLREIVETALGR